MPEIHFTDAMLMLCFVSFAAYCGFTFRILWKHDGDIKLMKWQLGKIFDHFFPPEKAIGQMYRRELELNNRRKRRP